MVSGHGTEIFASRNWAFPSPTEISQYRAHTNRTAEEEEAQEEEEEDEEEKEAEDQEGEEESEEAAAESQEQECPHISSLYTALIWVPVAIPLGRCFNRVPNHSRV